MNEQCAHGDRDLSSVLDYAAAIQRIGAGQFTNRFSLEGQRAFASFYGAPFFAMSKLAPESIEALGANLLLISANPGIADDGGRWLSLFAKAHKPSQKFNLTVCVPSKPRSGKAPKPLLFQPPQQVLMKDWGKHLEALDAPPAVVIFQPLSLEDLESATEKFSRYAAGSKILVTCHTHPDTVIARRLLELYGYPVGEILSFPLINEEPQQHANGAWWFSAITPSLEAKTNPTAEALEELRVAHRAFIGYLGSATNGDDRGSIAAVYATRSTESVEGVKDVDSVRTLPRGGICLATGRFFSRSEDSAELDSKWEEAEPISAELLAAVPAAAQDRLALMLWLGRSVFKSAKENTQVGPDCPEVQVAEAIAESSEESTFENKVQPELADRSKEPAFADRQVPDEGGITHLKAPRPRLSRSAGTVNVLAMAALLGNEEVGSHVAFENAKKHVLQWLANKGFKSLDAVNNHHVEHTDGEVTIETDGEGTWAMRFDDRRSMEDGAIWRVEIALLGRGAAAVSLRMSQVRSNEGAPPPIASGVPGVISKIVQHIGLQDAGVSLADAAKKLKGGNGAGWFFQLLLNPHRTQPIIAISGNVDSSADRLAKRLAGVAHVVRIDNALSESLNRRFGRDRSVYGNAVRLYRPGFAIDNDAYQHPVWVLKGGVLPKWVADDLFEQACAISLEVVDLEDRAPSFQAIRNLLAEARQKASEHRLAELRQQAESRASSAEEKISQLQAIAQELEAALREQKAQNKYLAEQAKIRDDEIQATRRERNAALEENRQLKFQLSHQWGEVESDYDEADDQVEYPDSWDDLETWVELYGQNRLILHPKAAKAARDSPFKDVPLAYKAMDYLVRYYVPMRTRSENDTDAYQRSKQALAELGLEESDVGTADEIKRYKKEYKRLHDGREVTLDRHLKRGVGFGGEFQFRLYFWYDDVAQQVLVGHMPTHLTNRLSHNG
jgi:hypothetical protein